MTMTDFLLALATAFFFAAAFPVLALFAVMAGGALLRLPMPDDFTLGAILGLCIGAGVVIGAVFGWRVAA